MKYEHIDLLIRQALMQIEKQKMERKGDECLSDQTICDYLESCLSSSERYKIEEHLSTCSICRLKVATMIRLEREKEINDSTKAKVQVITEKLKIFLAWVQGHLVLRGTNADHSFGGALQPALARGELHQTATNLPPFFKTFHEYTIITQIVEEEIGKCEIRGQLTPLAKDRGRSRIRVDLFQDERKICSYPLEGDSFFFNGINPGKYEIKIREGDRQLVILALDVINEE